MLPGTDTLYKLWQRSVIGTRSPADDGTWLQEVYYLSYYGRGLGESFKYLFGQQPSFEEFMNWLQASTRVVVPPYEKEDVLDTSALSFWNEHGYVVLPNAVSAEQVAAARNAVYEFRNASPQQPESWYIEHRSQEGLMLELYQHEALETNRRCASIWNAYRQLYGNSNIYLAIDKTSFNPPEKGNHRFNGSALHWDVNLDPPIPMVLQGLLYLTDVTAADGAFSCVPGFHKKIDGWINDLPPGTNPSEHALSTLSPIPVEGKAGDLVIWHQALPHCATPNRATMPRIVQYIAYKPMPFN